jgi:hypothetical protein
VGKQTISPKYSLMMQSWLTKHLALKIVVKSMINTLKTIYKWQATKDDFIMQQNLMKRKPKRRIEIEANNDLMKKMNSIKISS